MLDIKKLLTKMLRTDLNWTTIPSASGSVRYKVIRGFVYIFVEAVSAPVNAWTDLCTIPADIRPPTYMYVKGSCGGYAKDSLTLYINAYGTLRISPSVQAVNNGYGVIIYPLIG